MKPGSYTLGPDSTIEVHLVLGPDAGAMAIGTHVSVTLTVAAGSEEPQEVVVDVYSPRQPIDDVGSCALAASTRREDTWTHLVYMHADNDLESPMLDDVREMADAFKDDDSAVPLNLIVLLDRAHDDGRTKRPEGAYDPQIAYSKTDETPLGNIVTCDGTVYPGTPSGSMLLQLVAPAAEGESGRWLLLERTPEKNMDDPSTLSSFIAKGIGNFRADKYMVNLNDHGGSWTGFGGDYSHMIDHLGNVGADNGAEANSFFYLDAMRDAIKAGMAAGFTQQGDPTPEERKVDIIGFDACLMSEYAVIKTLGPMAHYFLASEENEPGHGWDYAYLKPVDGGGVTSAYEYGKAIIEGFMLHRQTVLGGDSRYITTPPLTLTLTNMKSFHVFDEKMKEVSWILQKMMLVPMAEALELVQSVRATTYAWEGVWENDDLSRDGVEVSLRKFLEKLGTGATSTFARRTNRRSAPALQRRRRSDRRVRPGGARGLGRGRVPADAGYYFVENHNKGNNKGMGLYFPKYEDGSRRTAATTRRSRTRRRSSRSATRTSATTARTRTPHSPTSAPSSAGSGTMSTTSSGRRRWKRCSWPPGTRANAPTAPRTNRARRATSGLARARATARVGSTAITFAWSARNRAACAATPSPSTTTPRRATPPHRLRAR